MSDTPFNFFDYSPDQALPELGDASGFFDNAPDWEADWDAMNPTPEQLSEPWSPGSFGIENVPMDDATGSFDDAKAGGQKGVSKNGNGLWNKAAQAVSKTASELMKGGAGGSDAATKSILAAAGKPNTPFNAMSPVQAAGKSNPAAVAGGDPISAWMKIFSSK